MPLSQAQVAELLAKPGKDASDSKVGFWCDADGERHAGKPPTDVVGKFHGKAGSVRRTSKGATVRNLNGSRGYIAGAILQEQIAYYVIR